MEERSAVFFRVENNIGFIEFNQPDAKVNILNSTVMERLSVILDEAHRNKSLKVLVIRSLKKDVFIAGADIKEIEGITAVEEGVKKSKAGQAILNKIEDLNIPSVVVIDGVVLGGGCELALACTYRIATFNEKVSIGLPEVKLGIIPGFAGTYRLPKVVGLSQALTMILTGKTLSGQEAFKCGLVDKLFPQSMLDAALREFAGEVSLIAHPKSAYRRKKKKFIQRFLDQTFIGQAIAFRAAEKNILSATKGFYPAPLKALWVLKKTQGFNRRDALTLEAEAFAGLAITDVSKNLVKLFYLTEKFKKLTPAGSDGVMPKEIGKCAVLGAGVMGGGIAQLLSDRGIWVRLKDINYDAIAKGLRAAYKIYEQQLKRHRIKKHELDAKMARITGTRSYAGFRSADLVVEAVVENMEIKKQVFRELSTVSGEQTILCTNTSALSVTEMARETRNPSKVIGLHFFNPVNRMPLIEIIKTDFTSIETIVTTLNLTKKLGKMPILVKDSCGFLVNRILLGYINEAGRILEEGEEIEAVDRVMTDFGMPMGPFALSDEVGLDVGIKVLHILEAGLGERFKPVDVFKKVYEKKLLGKKSGKGFYIYADKKPANREVYSLLDPKAFKKEKNDDHLMRMLYIMINEAARCLEEKIVDDADSIDLGMIMGTGFPAFRGGLLRYADSIGVDKIVETLDNLFRQLKAERFKPCRYLLMLKEQGKKFYQE